MRTQALVLLGRYDEVDGYGISRRLFSEGTAPIPIFIVAVVCGAPFAPLNTGENIFIVGFVRIFFLAPFHPMSSSLLAIVTRFTRQMLVTSANMYGSDVVTSVPAFVGAALHLFIRAVGAAKGLFCIRGSEYNE
jgi:hypothetical protein